METIKKGLVVNEEFDNMFISIDNDIACNELITKLKSQLNNCTNKLFNVDKDVQLLLNDEDIIIREIGTSFVTGCECCLFSEELCIRHSVKGLLTLENSRILYEKVHAKMFEFLELSNSLYGEYNNLTSKLKALKKG